MTRNSFLTEIECKFEHDAPKSTDYFRDPICGTYSITEKASRELNENLENKRKIANVLAQRKCRGIDVPTAITLDQSESEKEKEKDKDWILETIDSLVSQYPTSPIEMLDEALVNLSYLIKHPSETIVISKDESWYLYSHDLDSVFYMLRQFEEFRYIKSSKTMSSRNITIEAKGWEKLSELRKCLSKHREQAFVAMWFDETMDNFFSNSIKPAIEHDGTKCFKIDLKEHNNKICDEIIAEIRRSSYLVADFTGNRGGVYFEAGFAYGLGIPVIWTIRKDRLDDVHFDTRQYNHIIYETEDELKKKLLNRIKATII